MSSLRLAPPTPARTALLGLDPDFSPSIAGTPQPSDQVASAASTDRLNPVTMPTGVDHEDSRLVDELEFLSGKDSRLAVQVAASPHHDELRSAKALAKAEVQGHLAVVHMEAEVLVPVSPIVNEVAVMPVDRAAPNLGKALTQ